MGVVYLLKFASGKSYVGISTQAPARRYSQHACLAKRGEQTTVYHAWRKHGAPTMEILESADLDRLHAAEVEWIEKLGTLTPGGYNTTPGGQVSPMLTRSVVERIAAKKRGSHHTAESRAKMSASQKGRPGPNKGKVFSQEVRDKMARANLGRTHTEQTKQKMAASRAAYWARRREIRDAGLFEHQLEIS